MDPLLPSFHSFIWFIPRGHLICDVGLRADLLQRRRPSPPDHRPVPPLFGIVFHRYTPSSPMTWQVLQKLRVQKPSQAVYILQIPGTYMGALWDYPQAIFYWLGGGVWIPLSGFFLIRKAKFSRHPPTYEVGYESYICHRSILALFQTAGGGERGERGGGGRWAGRRAAVR